MSANEKQELPMAVIFFLLDQNKMMNYSQTFILRYKSLEVSEIFFLSFSQSQQRIANGGVIYLQFSS